MMDEDADKIDDSGIRSRPYMKSMVNYTQAKRWRRKKFVRYLIFKPSNTIPSNCNLINPGSSFVTAAFFVWGDHDPRTTPMRLKG